MNRFYKVNDFMFVEIGYVETINMWYADLIDFRTHEKIATNDNTDKIKLIASIVRDKWFGEYTDNFALFIEDVLKK